LKAMNLSPARARLALSVSAVLLVVAVLVATQRSGGVSSTALREATSTFTPGDPFSYRTGRDAELEARATAGSAHVLFTKSPGGVVATAARVAGFRPQIEAAAAGSDIDPALLEGIVFLESAGRPDAMAGSDPSAAAGLTQILAETGQSLLGMHIDLARSRALTKAIGVALSRGRLPLATHYERERIQVDDRFNPRLALAATVRYLELARRRVQRGDLAVVSYHMGIGNLEHVLSDYDGGRPVPYAQLYFDTTPQRHAAAFRLLNGFGDDSSLYYWRVLGAMNAMRLYRTDRAALARLNALQTARNSAEEVLHPPDRTPVFKDAAALRAAFASRELLALPSGSAAGIRLDRGVGALARRVGTPSALYRGLRPAALGLLLELGARTRALAGGQGALTVTSTVRDLGYQRLLGAGDIEATHGYSLHTTGYAFDISRAYDSRAQAMALQSLLDRLQALNLIAWLREPAAIHVTVAQDAAEVLAHGP
jgi:hypothetical protein